MKCDRCGEEIPPDEDIDYQTADIEGLAPVHVGELAGNRCSHGRGYDVSRCHPGVLAETSQVADYPGHSRPDNGLVKRA